MLAVLAFLSIGSSAQVPSTPSSAPTDEDRARAFQLSRDIMSPFCPGRTLAACPSGAAADLRSEIAGRLAAGESRAAILDWLQARYGDVVRGAPRTAGIGLAMWIAPAGIGGLILAALLASARGRAPERTPVEPPNPTAGGENALLERLDDELAELD
jgi:cytochrome c-type biogenesis protein CcmH